MALKIAVLTATKRTGGLDVTFESLCRQTLKPHVWIIADELQYSRMVDGCISDHWGAAGERGPGFAYEHFEPICKKEGYYSNLPAIYNVMMERARSWGCDYAVSLQDYISIPSDGLELFAEAAQEAPGALLSGLCSMTREPGPEKVADPYGLWTIFEQPFSREDWGGEVDLEWADVRGAMFRQPGLNECSPMAWEMNWAMFPLDTDVRFDETYGEHIGHENVQYAWASYLKEDRKVFIQPDNHALSLPHRNYFPDEWAEQQEHRDINQRHHQEIYGGIERLRSRSL